VKVIGRLSLVRINVLSKPILKPGWCQFVQLYTVMYSIIYIPSIVCAMLFNENAVACSFLLGSKNVQKEGAVIYQFVDMSKLSHSHCFPTALNESRRT
jgi:hypothetical protein